MPRASSSLAVAALFAAIGYKWYQEQLTGDPKAMAGDLAKRWNDLMSPVQDTDEDPSGGNSTGNISRPSRPS
ncbi:hypothetical protein FN846DRAFT_904780 [Sphaerosporella brunnea]|uniref:Uncharacterized protein n=1 Tax=Sphaerosporella brunnea TaxID=1250544 RepID=A0A5J5F3J5_9PEZI|nr:hypothetical protein FN846DRAFT_904780 [Sphaerosporella brunnea]